MLGTLLCPLSVDLMGLEAYGSLICKSSAQAIVNVPALQSPVHKARSPPVHTIGEVGRVST